LKPAILELSSVMKVAAKHLARHLDTYLSDKLPSLKEDYFEKTIETTQRLIVD
jgi:hypothetical protein